MRQLGQKSDQDVSKVEELLLPDGGGWDEATLNNLFLDSDVADILKIQWVVLA
jgi:hypothetical protein